VEALKEEDLIQKATDDDVEVGMSLLDAKD